MGKVRPWGRFSACLGADDLPQPCSSSSLSPFQPLSVGPGSAAAHAQHNVKALKWGEVESVCTSHRGAGAWQQQHFDPVHTSTPQFSHPVLSVETLRHVLLHWRHCTIWIAVSVIEQPQCLVRIGAEKPVDFNCAGKCSLRAPAAFWSSTSQTYPLPCHYNHSSVLCF